MESINIVLLSGKITEDAVVSSAPGFTHIDHCEFKLTTFRPIGKGRDKTLSAEEHTVWLLNPGTVMKYLKNGKSVTIQGRVIPGAGVLATGVHFP